MDPLDFSNLTLDDPALTPPPGVIPNSDIECGDHSLGYGVIILGIVVSTLSVIVRLISSFLKKKLRTTDGLLVLGWAIYMAFAAVVYTGAVHRGLPCHQWNYPVRDLIDFQYKVHIASILYAPAMICLKSAILLDWMHLFCPAGRDRMWWVIQFMIWGNVVFYVVGCFAEIFQCLPREKIWNVLYDGPGYCGVDIAANNFSGALINLCSDLAILALPNWRVWRLSRNVTIKKKVGISVLFATGIVVCVFGALRLIGLVPLISQHDMTYWISLLGLYSCLEMGFGFLILALPATALVVKKIPISEPLITLFRSLTDSYGRWTGRAAAQDSSAPSSPRQGPESGPNKKKLRGVWSIPELEETQLDNSKLGDKRESSIFSNGRTIPGSAKSDGDFKLDPDDGILMVEPKKVTGSDLV